MNTLEDKFDLWLPSPLQDMPGLGSEKGLRVLVKRDDLIHHHISGNKYRKLVGHLQAWKEGDYTEMLAFGGPFSNLLYTLSFMHRALDIPMRFFIRGDGDDPGNPTLRIIKENGVQLFWLDRDEFRRLRKTSFRNEDRQLDSRPYIIPEGASDANALPGAREIVQEITTQLGEAPDHIVMDLGTGGTFAGVLQALPTGTRLTGIPVVKGVDWTSTLSNIFGDASWPLDPSVVSIIDEFHFGGFARYDQALIRFINNFTLRFGIPVCPIYTGKLVFGLNQLINRNYFEPDSTVVWLHGGGLQGIQGFNYRHGPLIR